MLLYEACSDRGSYPPMNTCTGVAASSPWIHLQDVPKEGEERRREEKGRKEEERRKKKEERRKKKEERKKKKEERREGESWSQTATCNPISPLSGGDRDLGGFGRPVKYLSSGKRHHQHNTHFFYTEKCFSGVHFSETSSSRRH